MSIFKSKKLITYLVLFCLLVSLIPTAVFATGTTISVNDNTGLQSITISEENIEYDICTIEGDTYPTYAY